jgi:hypothetical protein
MDIQPKRPGSLIFLLVGLVLLVMVAGLIAFFAPIFACPLPRHETQGSIVCYALPCPRCGDNGISLWNKWSPWRPRTPEEEAEIIGYRHRSILSGRPVIDEKAEEIYQKIEESTRKENTLRIRFRSEQVIVKGGKRSTTHCEGVVNLKEYARIHASVRIQESPPETPSDSEGLLISDGRQLLFDFPRLKFKERSTKNDFCVSHLKSTLVKVGASVSLDMVMSPDDPSGTGDGALLSEWAFGLTDLRRGPASSRGQTLTYLVGCESHTFPFDAARICRVSLEYDPIRWLPLSMTLVQEQSGYECREVYEEVLPNADIPDETFKLPGEKK